MLKTLKNSNFKAFLLHLLKPAFADFFNKFKAKARGRLER